jgi:hypothetical protein
MTNPPKPWRRWKLYARSGRPAATSVETPADLFGLKIHRYDLIKVEFVAFVNLGIESA